jgi:hypothetical protein
MGSIVPFEAGQIQRFAQRIKGVAHKEGFCIVTGTCPDALMADVLDEARQRLCVFGGEFGGDDHGLFHF